MSARMHGLAAIRENADGANLLSVSSQSVHFPCMSVPVLARVSSPALLAVLRTFLCSFRVRALGLSEVQKNNDEFTRSLKREQRNAENVSGSPLDTLKHLPPLAG